MSLIYAIKGPGPILIPADHESEGIIQRLKPGQGVRLGMKRVRDIIQHRRFFKMLTIGYDAWEPPELQFAGLPVIKNPETFRKECIKAAGFYDVVAGFDGSVRLEAHSMSFANMEEDAFLPVYRGVKEVLLQRVLQRYTDAELERVTWELMRF